MSTPFLGEEDAVESKEKNLERLKWIREQIDMYQAEVEQAKRESEEALERLKMYQRAIEGLRYTLQIEEAKARGKKISFPTQLPLEKPSSEIPTKKLKKTAGLEMAEITLTGQTYSVKQLHQMLSAYRGKPVLVNTVREAALRTTEFFEKVGPNLFKRK